MKANFERLSPGQVRAAGQALKNGGDQDLKDAITAGRAEAADEIRRIFGAGGELDLVESAVATFDAVLVHAEPDDSAPADLEILRTRVRDEMYEIARYRNPGRRGQLKTTIDRALVNQVRDEVAEILKPILSDRGWAMPSTVLLCENEELLVLILEVTGRLLIVERQAYESSQPQQPASLFDEQAA